MSIDAFDKPKSGIGGFLHTSGTSKNEKLAMTLANQASNGDLDNLKDATYIPAYAEASKNSVVLSVATNAVSRIATLREKQLDLATTAKNSVDPTKRDSLEAEFQLLNDEIERIGSVATVFGEDLEDGTTLDTIRTQEDFASINGTADFSALTAPISASFATQTEAEDVETVLEQSLLVTYAARTDMNNKENENDNLIEEKSVERNRALAKRPEDPVTIETALRDIDKISKGIANQLRKRALEDPDSPIDPLHKLEPSKVAALLSD